MNYGDHWIHCMASIWNWRKTSGYEDDELERDYHEFRRLDAGLARKSSEKEKWRYNCLHDIIQQSWEILAKRLQHFNGELEQKTFWAGRTSTESALFEPLGSILPSSMMASSPNPREMRSIRLKALSCTSKNLGFMAYQKRSHFLLTCVERLCLSSLLKEETKAQCWARIK